MSINNIAENLIRSTIEVVISRIMAFDSLESQHIEETLQWIHSGEPLCRIEKPAIPPKHLVSYFVLFDQTQQKLLLVDHRKACLWLPSGGHVEPGELPRLTVERECMEELGLRAEFWSKKPLFLTSTQTVGLTAGHTDISLWYVLKGDSNAQLVFDKEEFNSIKWFAFEDIPFEKTDPHMRRFIQKLHHYCLSKKSDD